jgi:hypothetical protein
VTLLLGGRCPLAVGAAAEVKFPPPPSPWLVARSRTVTKPVVVSSSLLANVNGNSTVMPSRPRTFAQTIHHCR